eukprot:scaffold121865_cov17-Tisochrysis_lutea.AAC.2
MDECEGAERSSRSYDRVCCPLVALLNPMILHERLSTPSLLPSCLFATSARVFSCSPAPGLLHSAIWLHCPGLQVLPLKQHQQFGAPGPNCIGQATSKRHPRPGHGELLSGWVTHAYRRLVSTGWERMWGTTTRGLSMRSSSDTKGIE